MEPCSNTSAMVQVLGTVGGVLSGLLTIWLAHRRAVADQRQRAFFQEVRNHMKIEEAEISEGKRFSSPRGGP